MSADMLCPDCGVILPCGLNEHREGCSLIEADELTRLRACLRDYKRWLDDIAQALHPHKPAFTEERWTYLPDQLAGMVESLQVGIEAERKLAESLRKQIAEHPDTKRLDWLEHSGIAAELDNYVLVWNKSTLREAIDQAMEKAE